MNSNLVAVDQEIEDENFGIASFSIDPRKDTPEVLKAYEKGKKYIVDWTKAKALGITTRH